MEHTNTPLADGKYVGSPVWAEVDVSRSGNLVLNVLWRMEDENGVPLKGTEAAKSSHVLAFGDESKVNETIKSREDIRSWATGWDGGDNLWFIEHFQDFKACRARVTVTHETWEGRTYCRGRWVDSLEGKAKTREMSSKVSRDDIQKRFGKLMRAIGTPSPKRPAPPAHPAPKKKAEPAKPARIGTQADAWESYVNIHPGTDTTNGAEFWALVASVVPGVPADKITPEDWGRVLDRIEMPF